MAQRSIPGNQNLAKKIRFRRNELNLTIEEAASRAGVGSKTWSRYEAGESIRIDKCKGICKALNWKELPIGEEKEDVMSITPNYKDYEAWSTFLEENFGTYAAISFAEGSDILLDHIKEDLIELSSMPKGTHIGQLGISWLKEILPEQFLMNYDYDFLFLLKCSLLEMRMLAKCNSSLTVKSVLQELILYLCHEESSMLLELNDEIKKSEEDDLNSKDWIFDLFGDMDLITYLYSNSYLDINHPYHFFHWEDDQFFYDD